MIITANFEQFQYFNFATNFLKIETLFQKAGVSFFKLKVIRLKTRYFYTKPPFQKPVLRQIKWGVQNGTITWNDVLPVTNGTITLNDVLPVTNGTITWNDVLPVTNLFF